MANAIVGALRVILGADTAEFDSAMKRTASSAKSWSTNLNSIGREATAAGTALTKTLTLPLIAFGAASIKAASDFESSFAGVKKTVNATEPEFAKLSQGLRDMAKEIPITVNELNKVAESAGQLGIKKDDILSFTRVMADLGVTTNLTADEAATATAQLQNIFGAAGKDVDRFGATLVALGNDGASTEKDIIAMGLRIAGAGHQVGLTQAQVLGFASALSSVGINAESGGSAISRTFLKINDAVAKGGADLAEFARVAGMTGPAFKQAFETDAAGATTAFIKGLARLKAEGENTNATIENLVGKNIIIKDTLLRAAGAGDLLTHALEVGKQAWADNSALAKEASQRYRTFESQLKVLWNQIQDVAITLGTSLLPILKDLIHVVTPMVGVLGQAAQWFAALPEPIRMTALGIGALVAATGPMLWLFGQLALSAGTLAKQFTSKGLVMKVITADYGALAVAARGLFATLGPLALAIAAIWAAWKLGNTETVKNAYAQWGLASDDLAAKLFRVMAGIDKMTPAQAKAAVAATAAAESASAQAKALKEQEDALKKASVASEEFIGPVQDLTKGTREFVEQTDEAKKKALEFANSLKALGGKDAQAGVQEVLKQLAALNGPLNVLPSKLEDMAQKLRDGAQAALLIGKSGLAGQYTKLAETLSPIVQFQQRYNVTIGEYVTQAHMAEDATAAVWEQFYRLAGLTQKIGPALKSTMDFSGLFVGLKATIKENLPDSKTWSQAWDGMREGLAQTLADLPGTFSRAFEGSGGILGALKSIGVQLASAISTPILKELSKLQQAAVSAGAGVAAALGGAAGGGTTATIAGLAGGLGGAAVAASTWGTAMAGAGVAGTVALGAATMGIGAAAVGIAMLIKHNMGLNDAVKKANVEIEKLRVGLINTYGNMENLEAAANRVGLSFQENWGHQGQGGLKAMNDLMAEFERRTKAVGVAVEQAISGFSAVVTGMTEPWRKLGKDAEDAAKTALDAFNELKKVKADDKSSTEQITKAQDAYNEAFAKSAGLADQRLATAEQEKTALADLGTQAIATFAAAMAGGKSYGEAMAAVGPSLKTLNDAYVALGVNVEDVALQHLLLQSTVAEGNPALMTAVGGLGSSMQALAQLGLLNVDTFGAMQRTGEEMYARLQGAVAAAGGTTRDALLPMQGYLQEAAAQAKLLGIPLDDNTQLLVDQSKELGIWKDKGKSSLDLLIDGMSDLVNVLKDALSQTLGITGAINGLPERKHVQIDIDTTENVTRNITEVTGGNPDEGHAVGTMGRYGQWFKNFGPSFSTSLHGIEAVVTQDQAPAFAMDVLGSMGVGSSMGSSSMDTSGIERRLDGLVRLWSDFPRAVAVAQSDSTTLKKRK